MELLPSARALRALLLIVMTSLSADAALAAIGRTPGEAQVTPAGEAAYSVPLRLPPGTNGMTPSLSFEYRHRQAGGLLGVGWSIGGLSRIERCVRTVAQDGAAGPVTQSAGDRFCLDGQRLVVANGYPYGAAGSEYRTEIESFSRVRAWGRAGGGPAYFVVEAPDGRVLEYGATADSRIDGQGTYANDTVPARAWALNRIRDRSGNAISFEYAEDAVNGSYRIVAIRYNQNPGLGVAASHVVSFVYESRPVSDVDASYVAGTSVRQVVRLARIDVQYNGVVIRRYDLTYEPVLSSAGRSRLVSIQECGSDGSDCLAATVFAWQDGAPGFSAESSVTASTSVFDVLATDVNGDGRDDLLWSGGSPVSQTIRYRLALQGGGFGPEINTGVLTSGGVGASLDVNGDGYGDLAMVSPAGQWLLLPGGASGFAAAVTTGIPAGNVIDFRGADMNGDGLDDLAYSELEGQTLVVQVRYAQPGGALSAVPVKVYDQYMATGYDWYEGGDFLGARGQRIDLDGDGRDDLLMNESYSMARIAADQSTSDYFDSSFYGGTPADINGDGCTDFVYPHHTGRWRVRFSGCQVLWWPPPELIGPSSAGLQFGTSAMDWNGDGKDDIVYRTGAATWQVMVSTGSALLPGTDSGVAHNAATVLLSTDVNGDGLQDFVTWSGGQLRYRERAGPKPDLLLSAADGFGVRAAFAYAPLTSGIHAKSTGAAYPDRDLQDSRQVVATLSVSDGSGSGAVTTYRYAYEGLRTNVIGRGDLGFARRTITDGTLGYDLRTEESFRQDHPFIGLSSGKTIRRASGLPVIELASHWSALSYGSGTSLRQFPYLSSVMDKRYEAGGSYDGTHHKTTTMTVAAVDYSSGLVTDQTVTVTEAATGIHAGSSSTRRLWHASVFNDIGNWCLGRPQATQVTGSHTLPGGSAVIDSSSQSWDGIKCRPVQQQVEPGSSQWQATVSLAYDGFGNPSSRVTTGAGMGPRTETLGWGPRGQFPVTVVNALGHATTLAWDYAQGVPVSLTDPNSLKTTWGYDGFGRPVSEVRPDLTRTTWERTQCAGGCDARTRYVIRASAHNSSGAVQQTRVGDFDQFGRPYRIASQVPGGGYSVLATDFDARGRPSRRHLPHWQGGPGSGYRQYSFDELDRVTAEVLYDGSASANRSWSLAYDGLTTTRMDARGHTSVQISSAWGDVLRATDALGGSTSYQYDGFGRLTLVTDALNNVVSSIAYNVRGMKTSQTDLDLGTWTYTPNALGELVTQTNSKNQTTSFTYDKLSRLLTRTEPEGLSNWVWGSSSAAKNIGQLVSVSGPGYAESYTYDAWGRPASRSIVSDATYQYAFAYNNQGLLDTLTYPVSTGGYRLKLGYEYAQGQLVRVRDRNVPATVLWELNAQDAAGNVVHETLGSAIGVVTGFSPLTGLIEYRQAAVGAGSDLQNLAYQWDAADNLIARQDLNQGLVESFEYDALDRLGRTRRNGVPDLELRYDAIGNVTWKSDVGPYGYDPRQRHAVRSAGSNIFAYDASGNVTQRNGASLSWFSYNRPATLRAANGSQSQFSYAPDRSRWRQVASDAGVTETSIYIGGLMEKVTRSGVTTYRHYIQSPTGTAALYLRRSGGSPAEATYYLTYDHLGSTDKVLNAAGVTVAVAESFDAFGRRRASNWSGAPDAGALTAIAQTTRDGFTGHEHLDNLGLIHMNGRVYDPLVARFMSADPFIQAPYYSQSLNRYSYVWNNPLSLVDPSGFEGRSPADGGGKWLCWNANCGEVIWWMNRVRAHEAANFVSAAQRDPCGQFGSAMACHQPRGGVVEAALTAPAANVSTLTTGTSGGAFFAYWRDAAIRDYDSARDSVFGLAETLRSFVPGADFSTAAQTRFLEGDYSAGTALMVGGIADAGLGFATGGYSTRARQSIAVIGRYIHHYDEVATRQGARHFHVPANVFRNWSVEKRWSHNRQWLDQMIKRRNTFWLVTPLEEVGANSWLRREINYLRQAGYTLGDDGLTLTPPPR